MKYDNHLHPIDKKYEFRLYEICMEETIPHELKV